MPYYQDDNLAMRVIVDDTLQNRNSQCKWVEHPSGFYMMQCESRNVTLTLKEKDAIAIEIVGTVTSRFRHFQKYFLVPFELSYQKLPLTVDIQTGYHCEPGNVAQFKSSNPPEIRLCSTNVVSDVRHEAIHWFLWALNENFSDYRFINEGYTTYFADGVCSTEIKTYAYLIRDKVPKIADLLLSNQQTPSYYHHYILGSLLGATLHQQAKKEHFLALFAKKPDLNTPKKFQQLYQKDFENFIRNLSYFCYEYPDGIFPRSKTTETKVTHLIKIRDTSSQSISQSIGSSTFASRLMTQGFVGVVNGTTHFFLEKTAKRLHKNYPYLERSIIDYMQPIVSSAIHSSQLLLANDMDNLTSLKILEKSAIAFGLNCVSGIAIQFIIKQIKGIAKRNNCNTLLKTIFFLHTMAMVLNADNPAEAAIEHLITSVAAMLTYLFFSLVTSQCTKTAENVTNQTLLKSPQQAYQQSNYRFLNFFKAERSLSPDNQAAPISTRLTSLK